MLKVESVPSDPRRKLPHQRGFLISETRKLEIIPTTGSRKNRELVLEDETTVLDDVVDDDQRFESDAGVSGGVKTVHDGFDGRSGCSS
jgi:hypothetical protein